MGNKNFVLEFEIADSSPKRIKEGDIGLSLDSLSFIGNQTKETTQCHIAILALRTVKS